MYQLSQTSWGFIEVLILVNTGFGLFDQLFVINPVEKLFSGLRDDVRANIPSGIF